MKQNETGWRIYWLEETKIDEERMDMDGDDVWMDERGYPGGRYV